jgi:GrpB-like predicted nucleotidyltransferase (UPF0157 family)
MTRFDIGEVLRPVTRRPLRRLPTPRPGCATLPLRDDGGNAPRANGPLRERTAMSDQPTPDPIINRLRDVTIGGIEHREIVIAEYDPAWPQRFAAEAERISTALGDRARHVEHVGSTAVPGLAAKPIIDILLVVDDPADEDAYVPALEGAGYALRIREPDFHEHRMLRTAGRDVHLHVFGPGSPEVDRLVLLRDTLRADPSQRRRYEQTKRDLAARTWPTMQHYADAKSGIIEQILQRAGWSPADPA